MLPKKCITDKTQQLLIIIARVRRLPDDPWAMASAMHDSSSSSGSGSGTPTARPPQQQALSGWPAALHVV